MLDFLFGEKVVKITTIREKKVQVSKRMYSEEEVITVHQQYLSLGYEGTMIRHSEQGYQVNMRSS